MDLRRKHSQHQQRAGFTMLLVLVLVAALSLAVYSFSRLMLTQLEVVKANYVVSIQRQLAESAIECELYALQNEGTGLPNREASRGTYKLTLPDGNAGQFAVVQSLPTHGKPMEWGLSNESAKLNLNSLATRKLSRAEVIEKLLQTPRVTSTMAEAIATKLGIKEEQQTVSERQSFRSLDELLTIPGISEEVLYGEDLNCNGVMEEHENDGTVHLPNDNADGRLQRGLHDYWTITGCESNFRSDGRLKINLNNRDLVQLYDELLPEFGVEVARFVVAWRSADPTFRDAPPLSEAEIAKEREREMAATLEERIRMQLGLVPDQSAGGSELRGGLLLSRNAGRPLKSILDLAHCQVQVTIDGNDTVLLSPLDGEPSNVAKWLPDWELRTTVSDGWVNSDRINISHAPYEVLMTVDGMTPSVASAIVRTREQVVAPDKQSDRQTLDSVAWLTTYGITNSWQLRKLAAGITTGGSVTSGIAIGQLNSSRTAAAIRFTLDARIPPARLQSHQELNPLSVVHRLHH